MKPILAVGVLIAATIAFSDERRSERQQITTKQIAEADVVGSIGVPLGTCAKIKATLTTSDSNAKGEDGVYYLEVTAVDGQNIEPPVRTRFSIHRFATKNVKLANDNFALYELATGKKTESLNQAQVIQLRKQFVGKPFTLVVYETGGFSGIPRGLPKEVLIWQDRPFHFQTALVVVDQQ